MRRKEGLGLAAEIGLGLSAAACGQGVNDNPELSFWNPRQGTTVP